MVVAVSPIVGGAAIKGPADRLLKELWAASRALPWVAHMYADLCDLFVFDEKDADQVKNVRAGGTASVALDTIMSDHDASTRLAGRDPSRGRRKQMSTGEIRVLPIDDLPEIREGDDLAEMIVEKNEHGWQDDDVLIVAQKAVSKAEGPSGAGER